ncbi:lignin-forming anionic peroxidase-like [Salvia miltiorrhiza]|uniref:lignin-forming anionic peroxidase-like n=1 Tax=Salvia miltiorrhiza TaxID=226208 RepID=UPI0025AD4039|nr:lignin-forming anionic peroxidase-like [Salvia miltiorrhiza]
MIKKMISSNYYFVTVVIILMLNVACEAQLSSTFYDSTCPNALSTIRTSIRQAVSRERRMAASLVRLHFHDCFVQGCDASLLLDDTTGERVALQNANSVRGFEVVEAAKQAVEAICPGVVSCADVLAVAARDATVAVGGPSWKVTLGRRDSPAAASRSLAETDLPRFTDPLPTLISNFQNKNLNERDMVALSGSHTIGQARCVTFRNRIYSNISIDPGFASTRQRQCPQTNGNGDGNLAPLDLVTPNSFDNNYFKNLIQRKGLLESDQVLFSGGSSDSIVQGYINNPATFSADFAAAMIKMGNIQPLTAGNGIIRRTCASVN